MATKKQTVKPTIVESETTVIGENPNKTWAARIDDFMTKHVAIAGVCGWKRALAAWIGTTLGCLGLGYLIGQVTAVLAVAALLGTGSVFLMYAIIALGLVASYYAGGRFGVFLFRGITTNKWNFTTEPMIIARFSRV